MGRMAMKGQLITNPRQNYRNCQSYDSESAGSRYLSPGCISAQRPHSGAEDEPLRGSSDYRE